MQFFDDKQEVMDVVITPFGKHLLSQGRFSPEYYAFFDDDIMYDTAWVTGSTIVETQNNIEGRIQHETPRIKQPAVYTGVESAINVRNAAIRAAIKNMPHDSGSYMAQDTNNHKIYNQEGLQFYGDKFDFLKQPLGRSEQSSKYLPAWNISMLRGAITGSQDYLELPHSASRGTPGFIENIPQININLNYKVYVSEVESEHQWTTDNVTVDYGSTTFPIPDLSTIANPDVGDVFPPGLVQSIASEVFNDGTYFSLQNGKIILEIVEENVNFKKENFDIQVFASSSSSPGDNVSGMQQLFFTDDISNLQIDDSESYLSIRVDKGIDDARINNMSIGHASSLTTDSATTNVISTREFMVRDLYNPEEDICE